MIRRFTLLTLFIATVMTAAAQMPVVELAQVDRYALENTKVPPRQKGEKRVVFIGNSIVELWNTVRPDFFPTNGYINRGIGGQTSYTILMRFRNDVINLDPTIVVIGAGANDIATGNAPYYNEDTTFANIINMVELAQANGIKPVLTSLLPADEYRWHKAVTDVPDKIDNLNRRIKAYADAHNIPYADYYTPLVHPGDRALTAAFTEDGCHPTSEGYALMEPIIQKILKRM